MIMKRVPELSKILKTPLILNEVKPGDNVLIITDTIMDEQIVEAMVAAIHDVGAEPTVAVMLPRSAEVKDPPAPIAQAIMGADLNILLTVKSTLLSSSAYTNAMKAGKPFLTMDSNTIDILLNAGTLEDYVRMNEVGEKVKALLDQADEVHVTTPLGTNFNASIKGRKAYNICGKAVCFYDSYTAAFPDGNIGIALIEGSAEGTVVIDTTITHVGLVKEPITVTVRNGKVVRIEGGREASIIEQVLKEQDEEANELTYLGLGLNSRVPLTGIQRSDKKRLGQTFCAFGNTATIGGKNNSNSYIFSAFSKATIKVEGVEIMTDGKLNI